MIENSVILTDCDGCLLNWEYAFDVWVKQHGYTEKEGADFVYGVNERYGVTKETSRILVKQFNESAAIGFIPALRDALYYVRKLHERHGYVFHVITSLSTDPASQRLRIMNLEKLFGNTVFEKYVFLGTGDDKDEELAKYRDTNYLWIEDKIENAELGKALGLDAVMIEHGHNMHHGDIPLMKNWRGVYEYVTGES